MPKLLCALLACLWTLSAYPAATPATADAPTSLATSREPDSGQMEKDLQHLPWKRFRSVVEAIPKMKSSIEAYGPIGWQYVQANYTSYSWKQRIDKLDEAQKKRLAELIQSAKRHN